MSDSPQPSVLKRRGGIWTVIGLLLVGGIVAVGVWKLQDKGDAPPPETTFTPPKHLIVISIDTLRADHLGCYGYGKPTSPRIDALAKDGVVFERHYTCYPLTLPAHLTQLTGVSTLGHRVRDNLYHTLPGELQTLPEIMKARGFKTGAFVSAHTMRSGSGLERGFEVYDDRDVRVLQPGELTVRERIAPDTLALAGNWIAEQGSERMFCYIHLFDPHAPYVEHKDISGFEGDNTARYDGEIAYTDRELAKFLQRLDDIGVLKDCLLVITSDHGEGLGEHNELTHGYYCYDSTTHVPLIMHGAPGVKPGTRVPGIARNYDLAPTLVQLMGLEAPDFIKQMHGVSLVPAMREGTDLGLSAYVESHYAWLNADWAKIRGLRTKDSLTLFAGNEALYFTDAGQTLNTAGANEKPVSDARAEIERLMNAWLPPRKGTGSVRESTAGTPYPGEAAVAQDFEAEKLNDTANKPSPHTRSAVLQAYQAAELDYDAQMFAACAARLRDLLRSEPEFVMALKLLTAVNIGQMKAEWRAMGENRAKGLAREAADCMKRVSLLEAAHGRTEAQESALRDYARLLLWINDVKAMRELFDHSHDNAIQWMWLLVQYRTAPKSEEARIAKMADAEYKLKRVNMSFADEARQQLETMLAGKPLKLAPWE